MFLRHLYPACYLCVYSPEVFGFLRLPWFPIWKAVRATPPKVMRMSTLALTLTCASHNVSQIRADYGPTARKPDANGLWSWFPHVETSPSSGSGPNQGEIKPTRSTVIFMSLATTWTASPSTLQAGKELLVTFGIAYCNSGAKQLPGHSQRKKGHRSAKDSTRHPLPL